MVRDRSVELADALADNGLLPNGTRHGPTVIHMDDTTTTLEFELGAPTYWRSDDGTTLTWGRHGFPYYVHSTSPHYNVAMRFAHDIAILAWANGVVMYTLSDATYKPAHKHARGKWTYLTCDKVGGCVVNGRICVEVVGASY